MANEGAKPLYDAALHLILPHHSDTRMLLLAEGAVWALPQLEAPPSENVWDVFELGMDARAVLGCAVQTLHCPFYAPPNDEHGFRLAFVVENLDPAFQLPEGARWVSRDELAGLTLEPAYLRPVVERYFEERLAGVYPPERPPWAYAGWGTQAKTWVEAQIAANGWTLTGEIEQVRKWCITCVLKAPTTVGDLYFKAVPPTFAREVAVTRLLAELHPENLPTIVAANEAERWLLLRDFGQVFLGQSRDVQDWERAARDFAAVQVTMSRQIDALLERGAMDYRLEHLPEKLDALLADETMLKPDRYITAEEIEQVRALAPRIKAMMAELDSYNLPATIVHGDFHVWNTAVQEGRVIFFDWTDAAVGHPFYDMALFFGALEQAEMFVKQPDIAARLREVYLEKLTDFAPLEILRKALPLGETLGLVHQAVNYRHLLRSVEPEERWTLDYIGYQVKRILTQLEEMTG